MQITKNPTAHPITFNDLKMLLEQNFRPLIFSRLIKRTFPSDLHAANRIKISRFKPILPACKVSVFGTSCANL